MVNKPQYKHDCKKCVFLGNDSDTNYGEVDVYYCEENGIPRIVMRCSKEPSDFISTPIFLINSELDMFIQTPLIRNMLIAEDKGLFTKEKIDNTPKKFWVNCVMETIK